MLVTSKPYRQYERVCGCDGATISIDRRRTFDIMMNGRRAWQKSEIIEGPSCDSCGRAWEEVHDHVCGLMGYDQMEGDTCPECERTRKRGEGRG